MSGNSFGAAEKSGIICSGVSPCTNWSSMETRRSPRLTPHLLATLPGKTRLTSGYPLVIPPLRTSVSPISRLPCFFMLSIISLKPNGSTWEDPSSSGMGGGGPTGINAGGTVSGNLGAGSLKVGVVLEIVGGDSLNVVSSDSGL